MNTGATACNLACGACAECSAGTSSAVVGSTNKNDCVCSLAKFKSFKGSTGCDYCEADFFVEDGECAACPPGAKCATAPMEDVVLTTATTLGFEGGSAAFDKAAETAFESAIVEAMAAGSSR